jgi:hypothetical protein
MTVATQTLINAYPFFTCHYPTSPESMDRKTVSIMAHGIIGDNGMTTIFIFIDARLRIHRMFLRQMRSD